MMKIKTPKLFVLVLLLIVSAYSSACTQAPTLDPNSIPTLAVLPSPVPTDTPAPTDTPTITPIPSATPTVMDTLTPTQTFTPSDTPSPVPTETFTPSLTYTPSPTLTPTPTFTDTPTNTPLPSATPTFTITPSPTRTFTPRPTNTALPTSTPTRSGPVIVSFGADMNSVLPNTTIRLAWVATADSARIEQVSEQGALLQVYPVAPTGQYTLVVPSGFGRVVYYRLVAQRNGIESQQTISVTVTCPYTWFFGDQYVPSGAGCPVAPTSADGRYQPFERGVMIYVTANGLNRIYGVQYDQSLYVAIPNSWDGTTINSSAAPSGRFIPQEMFNWAYYNTLAPIGSWSSALGWATSDIVNAPRTIQFENAVGGTNPFVIDAPDGAIYRFSGGDSGTWSRLR